MGPLNDSMKKEMKAQQGDIKFDVTWTTLGEYLDHLVARGISPERRLLRRRHHRAHPRARLRGPAAHARGARSACAPVGPGHGGRRLGLGSSLIYAPGFYAKTGRARRPWRGGRRHGGMYISHMRSEGNRLLEAVDELITIAREAGCPPRSTT
jgi:N-acyl-D-amino-acid deacylase